MFPTNPDTSTVHGGRSAPPRSAAEERPLPRYVEEEFEAYLKCGRLEEGFLRVKCDSCQADKLVTFSCKRRGFCPSCGARRMAERAALLVDDVLPRQPVRRWVLSLPALHRPGHRAAMGGSWLTPGTTFRFQ